MDVQPDKYGNRVRARIVTPAGADLSQSLIQAGLARPYKGEKRQPWCESAGVG
jgi:endonuclease YncB( thermonuclease family)